MKRKYLIGLGLAIGCGATQAQTILPDTVRPSIIITDEPYPSDNETIKAIYEANGLHFQDHVRPVSSFSTEKDG